MSKDFLINLGELLKKERIAAGYSQENIAGLLKVSQSQYSKYERGTQQPPIRLLWKFCKICNIHLYQIFLHTDNHDKAEPN